MTEPSKLREIELLLKRLAQADCGSNSCLFGGRLAGGMRTNGRCKCYEEYTQEIIAWHTRELEKVAGKIQELKMVEIGNPQFEYAAGLSAAAYKINQKLDRLAGEIRCLNK